MRFFHSFVALAAAAAFVLILPAQTASAHGSFRKLTAAEIAHFRKVEAVIKAAFPKQAGSLKLIDASAPFDPAGTQIDQKRAADRGLYSLWYSFEYGRSLDDIRQASRLEEKISQAQNDGNDAAERALREQLAQLAATQRCYVDVGINHGLVNFNYERGRVEPLALKDGLAFRARHAEDGTKELPWVSGTFVGLGTHDKPRDTPYEGNEGGVFEVPARMNEAADFSMQHIVIRIYAAPAVADQLLRQLDLAGLKAMLGKRI